MATIAVSRILVPTDFSVFSEVALTYGKAMAEAFKAELHILHVLEDPGEYARKVESQAIVGRLREQMDLEAQEQLGSLLSEDERSSLRAQTLVKWGAPFVEIVRYARDNDIDLIAMGTHGRGAVKHMLLGSVAEKVVRKAPCPVLTVRHPEHEFVMP